MAAAAAVGLVVVPAAFSHGGDPTRIHACVIPPQNAVVIVYAPGLGGDPDFNCESRLTAQGQHWKNLDWSITGAKGATGASGPSGTKGATGSSGVSGPSGPPGTGERQRSIRPAGSVGAERGYGA